MRSVYTATPAARSGAVPLRSRLARQPRRALSAATAAAAGGDNGVTSLAHTIEYKLRPVPHLSGLGHAETYPNPIKQDPAYAVADTEWWVTESERVIVDTVTDEDAPGCNSHACKASTYIRAGPRESVHWRPEDVKAAIVTCGGLCPGLNTVVREVVTSLNHQYGVPSDQIWGVEGGYSGFYSRNLRKLSPKDVRGIHLQGGTALGTSRGGHDTKKIVDCIEDRGLNHIYIIGGDGTQRGAQAIFDEVSSRGLKVCVVGIPKTIDNDVCVIDKSFGFDTAVEEAQRAIQAAHVEAESAVPYGVGLVKLMGRYSGFIAMHATLASRVVDCCLIPESPFYLQGPGGLYEHVRRCLDERGRAVIVVAEGAGQEYLAGAREGAVDASGNKLLADVGLWLGEHLKEGLAAEGRPITLKYIDPTYMIRAIPANASDNVYCTLLAHGAVHGAFAGYTGFVTGPVNGRHAYIPLRDVTSCHRQVVVTDRMWARTVMSTRQPLFQSCTYEDEGSEDLAAPLPPAAAEVSSAVPTPQSEAVAAAPAAPSSGDAAYDWGSEPVPSPTPSPAPSSTGDEAKGETKYVWAEVQEDETA